MATTRPASYGRPTAPAAGVIVGENEAQGFLHDADERHTLGQRQRRQEQQQGAGRADLRPSPSLLAPLQRAHEEEERPQARDRQVGRLLRREGQGENAREEVQVAGPLVSKVAPDERDHPHRPDGHEDVVAGKAAEVEERRREGQQHGREEGPGAAESVAEEPRHAHQRRAEERVQQPGRVVAVAEEEEDPAGGEELEGPVEQRVVLVAAALNDVPAVEGVQALVVVHGPVAQVPQAHGQGQGDEEEVGRHLPPDGQPPIDALRLGLLSHHVPSLDRWSRRLRRRPAPARRPAATGRRGAYRSRSRGPTTT